MDRACVLCTHTVSMYSIDTTEYDIPVIYFGLMWFEPLIFQASRKYFTMLNP
jgi:hypothetical protein